MTRSRAKQIIDANTSLAEEYNMCVCTIFREDMITGEIICSDFFSHSTTELSMLIDDKIKSYTSLDLTYALYVGDRLCIRHGTLQFENEVE